MLSKGALLRSARGEDWAYAVSKIKVGKYLTMNVDKTVTYLGYIGPNAKSIFGPVTVDTPGELIEYPEADLNPSTYVFKDVLDRGFLTTEDLSIWDTTGNTCDKNFIYIYGYFKNGELVLANTLGHLYTVVELSGYGVGAFSFTSGKAYTFSLDDIGKIFSSERVCIRVPVPEFRDTLTIARSTSGAAVRYGAGKGFLGDITSSSTVTCGGVAVSLTGWGVHIFGSSEPEISKLANFNGYSAVRNKTNAPLTVLKDKGIYTAVGSAEAWRAEGFSGDPVPTPEDTWEGETIPYALIGSDEVVTKLYEAYEKGKRALGGGKPLFFLFRKSERKGPWFIQGLLRSLFI